MKHVPFWMAVVTVITIVFNVCFFIVTANIALSDPSVWVCYACIHVPLALMLCTPLMARHNNGAKTDYQRPLYLGSILYFIAAIAVNTTLIALTHLNGMPLKLYVIIVANVLIIGIVSIYYVVNISANTDTAIQQERHEQELLYVKGVSSRLKLIASTTEDKNSARMIGKLHDIVASSPLRSCPEAEILERDIENMLSTLEDACLANDEHSVRQICAQLTDLTNRRNLAIQLKT